MQHARGLRRGRWVTFFKLALMPVGVRQSYFAGGVQFGYLGRREAPAYGAEILAELLFIARAHDYVRHGGPLQQPVQRDLRDAFAGLLGDAVDRIHYIIYMLVHYRRSEFGSLVQAALFVQRLVAANFSGEAAPAERTPDHAPNPLIHTERHQFPFVFASDERVVRLMSDVARPAVAFADVERFHEVPTGKIGAADIANLAALHEIVQRAQSFFDGSECIEPVHLIQVNVIGFQTAQAGFASGNQMMARGADFIGARPNFERRFRGDENFIAAPGDGLA